MALKSPTACSCKTLLASISWGRLPSTKIGVLYFIAAEGIEGPLDEAQEPKVAEEKR